MRAVILMIAFATCLVLPVRAADDIATAQATIRAQVDALGRDDGAAAYAFASPLLQQVFQQPELFMAMVRKDYAPIYRHKTFAFSGSKVSENIVAQKVQIIDAGGEPWEALYTLERQQDGTMRITGCTLVKETGA